MNKTFIVIRVLIIIGFMTGLWRSSGTISFFIYYGVRIINPNLFILMAFIVCALISFGLGTSFGTVATAGVVLMAIGRSGNVDELMCAGAIISGIYFGDRGSPASSAAALVAATTETDVLTNMKNMHKSALVPYILSIAFYTYLSVTHPISSVSENLLIALQNESNLSLICIIPALVVMILPLLKVKIKYCLILSAVSAYIICVTLQGFGILDGLKFAFIGYTPKEPLIAEILSGGGLISMISVFIMLILASILGALLEFLGFMDFPKSLLTKGASKIGIFPANMLLSLGISMILCNQTICIIIEQALSKDLYDDKYKQSLDIANSGLMIAACIPWCIAISVPLATCGVGTGAMRYDILVYLIPAWALICDFFKRQKKRHYRRGNI